ncbi:MAG: S1C family serine protease [Candidatus Desulfofervidaceae bacterium]|nr:S1C family serine protease [Candidatus Desulfofervidaceae bacterium]
MANLIKASNMDNKSKYEIHKLLAIISLFFLVNISSIVYPQTAQETAKKAFRSTVLLVMEDANGQPLSLGSGFFVGDGMIASNLHVVVGAVRGYAKMIGEKTKYNIEGITAIDHEHDLVILKVSARSKTLPLGNSDAVQVGEPVYAVGNPLGLEGTFSQGIVSSIRKVGSDKLLQITAPISPGSSGGPVLNSKGEVIGVSVATFKGGQNLNFAIPSNYLKILLGKANSSKPKPLAEAKPVKAVKSILAGLGSRSTEGIVGTLLTWDTEYAPTGDYSFSLRNQLRNNVKNVYCLVVFYARDGNPIDFDVVQYPGVIPAGLAKRVTGEVDSSVQELTTPYGSKTPQTKVEIRILDFRIVN